MKANGAATPATAKVTTIAIGCWKPVHARCRVATLVAVVQLRSCVHGECHFGICRLRKRLLLRKALLRKSLPMMNLHLTRLALKFVGC